MRQLNELNAFRQLDFGQVDGVADFQVDQLNFNEFRQVLRHAADCLLVQGMGDQAAAKLDAWGNIFVHKVERHLDVNLLGGADALEVDVLNGIAYRMQLIVT